MCKRKMKDLDKTEHPEIADQDDGANENEVVHLENLYDHLVLVESICNMQAKMYQLRVQTLDLKVAALRLSTRMMFLELDQIKLRAIEIRGGITGKK